MTLGTTDALKICCSLHFLSFRLLSSLAHPMLMSLNVSQRVWKGAEPIVRLWYCAFTNVPMLIEQMIVLLPPCSIPAFPLTLCIFRLASQVRIVSVRAVCPTCCLCFASQSHLSILGQFLLQWEKGRPDGEAKRGRGTYLILTTEQMRQYRWKERARKWERQQKWEKTTPS